MKILVPLTIITFWSLVAVLGGYLKKRGSKLGQEKKIYAWIPWLLILVIASGFATYIWILNMTY